MSLLKVDRVQHRTRVLGPGVRVAIWFHGCSRGCPGCIAAEMNRSNDFKLFSASELVDEVIAVDGVEGITVSGGEPFQQDLNELFDFLSGVRTKSSLSIMAYTGFQIEELRQDHATRRLLDLLDVLVDGPYVESLDDGQLWRGSGNQNIHFLSDRYLELSQNVMQSHGRPVEFSFGDGLDFSLTGIPPKGFKARLSEKLRQKEMDVIW